MFNSKLPTQLLQNKGSKSVFCSKMMTKLSKSPLAEAIDTVASPRIGICACHRCSSSFSLRTQVAKIAEHVLVSTFPTQLSHCLFCRFLGFQHLPDSFSAPRIPKSLLRRRLRSFFAARGLGGLPGPQEGRFYFDVARALAEKCRRRT